MVIYVTPTAKYASYLHLVSLMTTKNSFIVESHIFYMYLYHNDFI